MSAALREAAWEALDWIHYHRRAYAIDEPIEERNLLAALTQEEQFISLEELAEALGSPDIDSDSEIDKHDMLEMVELQRELLFHAISLNTKIRKRKT